MRADLFRRVSRLEARVSGDKRPVYLFAEFDETDDEAVVRQGLSRRRDRVTVFRWMPEDSQT